MSGWRREGCRITASPDLNTLFPASANLFATMANKINERGQISGMAGCPTHSRFSNVWKARVSETI